MLCSYVSVTFMLEAMATANAVIRLRSKGGLEEFVLLSEESGTLKGDGSLEDMSQLHPTASDTHLFQIIRRTELGEMAGLFFNEWGMIIFYTILILYLIGDSVIYSTLVARSLSVFFDDFTPTERSFDLYLGIFFCVSLPLCFFDFQKTKLLQMTTLAIRNLSLYTMIVLSAMKLVKRGRQDTDVPVANIAALPNLFGGAVYSFMCHHSLPGIITPMKDKSNLQRIVQFAFGSVIVVYLLLFVTSGLAFGLEGIKDPLTFNFPPKQYGFLGDCLFLFPVFTLSSSFPMLSITLRNNLDTLIQHISQKVTHGNAPSDTIVSTSQSKTGYRRILMTLLAVIPPTVLCYIAEHAEVSVDELVGFTGAFAGCAVMLIIPASLVYCSRREFAKAYAKAWNHQKTISKPATPKNIHQSPFSGHVWVLAILVWAGLSVLFNLFEDWELSKK
uniref:Amino acid transporter transmembrane domain-containing protein n=1 Tax=Physcomitrium patens TaxID=3218 RepID=A0A7I4FCT5_PHYPA